MTQLEGFSDLFAELRKNDVHADDIRVQAVHAGRVDDVGNHAAKVAISPPAQMIREEPPHIAKKVWPGSNIHAMPRYISAIYVFDDLAV
jgi:hypothetical protein